MVVGISIFELHLPEARSLKQKRKVIKGLIERIHRRFRVSIAETDYHDLHQRSEISLAAIARSSTDGQRLMDSIRDMIDSEYEASLTHWDPQLMEGMR
ncbi:MAG: DUF503 domain-containing protein [Acidobacteriota bacterium]